MKLNKLFNTALNYGVSDLQPAETHKVRTTNLLNIIVVFYLLIACSKYFILGNNFALVPVCTFLFFALVSLFLSKIRKPESSFVVFSLNVNLSIFFFNNYYPFETGPYLFYFPLIVSVVLLNAGSVTNRSAYSHLAICILFFLANFLVPPNLFRLQDLDTQQLSVLWYYNLIMSAAMTAILSLLLTRLISAQNLEIVQQNGHLVQAKESVNNTLKEKEVLLAELHHRVKNNLAIISGLLNLQGDATSNDEARQIISESKNRILSMALVHRMLFENPALKNINLANYTSELVMELFRSYNLEKYVDLEEEFEEIVLPVSKSIPLGLIMNEIVTNSIKYAFRSASRNRGRFFISITRVGGQKARLVMKDNGKGFPDNYNFDHPSLSLGIFLIKTLAEQIDGEVRFSNDSGARIELVFTLN